jgi:hypothetical protein
MLTLDERNPFRHSAKSSAALSDAFAIVLRGDFAAIKWKGTSLQVEGEEMCLPDDLEPNHIRILVLDQPQLAHAQHKVLDLIAGESRLQLECVQEHRAFFGSIHRGMTAIRSSISNFAEVSIEAIPKIRLLTGSVGCVDLIENYFTFASDFGYRTSRFIGLSKNRIRLNRALVNMSMG